jgi:hypothetical protein
MQDPYTLQLYQPRLRNVFDGTPVYSSPISPSTSLSSLPWSDSESSPTPCRFSDDAISRLSYAPPAPQTALPACAQSLEALARPLTPERPLPTSPALENMRRDVLGRRAPKQRRITRAVQPLACYFCRGRKIACGPPADLGSGNRTCEYVVLQTITYYFFFLQDCIFSLLRTTTIHTPAGVLVFFFPFSWRRGSAASFLLSCYAFVRMLTISCSFFFFLSFPIWYGQALCATTPRLRISCRVVPWPPCVSVKDRICDTTAVMMGDAIRAYLWNRYEPGHHCLGRNFVCSQLLSCDIPGVGKKEGSEEAICSHIKKLSVQMGFSCNPSLDSAVAVFTTSVQMFSTFNPTV